MMSKYIKIDDLRLHLQNLVLDGEKLDFSTVRLMIMTLRELPIHEVEEESMKEGVEKTQFVDANKKGDCISRQQVMDEIKRWRGYLDEDMIERINTRMNMLPPVTPPERTGWIPVSERLPEKSGYYIVSLNDAVDSYASFGNGKWYYVAFDLVLKEYREHEVIAWRPLPKPYMGGDTE